MNMKKYGIFVMAAMLTISLSITAQNAPENQNQNGRQAPQREQMTTQQRAENLAKQLNLTAEQTQKVQALYEKQDAKRAQQREEFRKNRQNMQQMRNAEREQMRAQRDKEMKEEDAELESIIGKEKMDQVNAMRAQRRERAQQRMDNRGEGMRQGGNNRIGAGPQGMNPGRENMRMGEGPKKEAVDTVKMNGKKAGKHLKKQQNKRK
jgi:Spy/CpxP family protein refolding chaperone